MIVKDWVKEAADEISRAQEPSWILSKLLIERIILERCPFKPDTAYMPVPRCDGCKRWARPDPKQDGICTLWKSNKLVVTTSADYGCVRWEAK